MDEKQLDLNAPLLSVRRLSTTSSKVEGLSNNSSRKSTPTRQQSLPVPRSQWEPEPEDTKPAAIPFTWEQIPGKAKHRKKSEQKTIQNFPIDEQSSDDSHHDAIETLSMSFSCNFSEENSDLESSGSFSSDLQTRDYLMNRFLPAAKSMIVETPQYVAKKQEAPVLEPPKYVKKVYSGELRPLLLEKYPISSGSPYNHEIDKEINVIDDTKKKSSKKGFGFFLPRICTKRSSCLSNPTPAPKTKIPDSPGPIPRLSRRTSYSGPLTPSIEKQAMDAVIRKRTESRSKEVHETRKSSPMARSGNSLPSSPSRGMSRSGRISPYRNESPRSPFHDGARFLGVPKDVQNHVVKPKTCPSFNVKSNFHDNPPVPEKTLYIDWIGKPTNNVIPDDGKVDLNGDLDDSEVPRVPPLPKSPSESWLWRKMSLRSPFQKKVQQQGGSIEKNDKSGPKWETIVKTSNVRFDHVRYSEERLNISKYTEISF